MSYIVFCHVDLDLFELGQVLQPGLEDRVLVLQQCQALLDGLDLLLLFQLFAVRVKVVLVGQLEGLPDRQGYLFSLQHTQLAKTPDSRRLRAPDVSNPNKSERQ